MPVSLVTTAMLLPRVVGYFSEHACVLGTALVEVVCHCEYTGYYLQVFRALVLPLETRLMNPLAQIMVVRLRIIDATVNTN